MTELAVIVPTRSRPHSVPRIIDAWNRTGSFGTADLWFVIDRDDMAYDEYLSRLGGYPPVRYMVVPEWQPMVPKLNDAAILLATSYPNVAFMGDDHLPRTVMWANKLVTNHAMNRAGIIYGRDGFQDESLATWWSMKSEIIAALGRMVPAPVQHMYCDNAVMELGRRTGVLHYDDSILIEHMHPVAGKAEMDAQYERVNRKQQYQRDGAAFRAWVKDGLDEDARIISNLGG